MVHASDQLKESRAFHVAVRVTRSAALMATPLYGAEMRQTCIVNECPFEGVAVGHLQVSQVDGPSLLLVRTWVCTVHVSLISDWWRRLPDSQKTAFLSNDAAQVDAGPLRQLLGREPFALLNLDGTERMYIDSTDLDGFRLWLLALFARGRPAT